MRCNMLGMMATLPLLLALLPGQSAGESPLGNSAGFVASNLRPTHAHLTGTGDQQPLPREDGSWPCKLNGLFQKWVVFFEHGPVPCSGWRCRSSAVLRLPPTLSMAYTLPFYGDTLPEFPQSAAWPCLEVMVVCHASMIEVMVSSQE